MLFIAIAFPDGTFLLRGPLAGHWNDLTALEATSLGDDLSTLLDGNAIGGDSIFPRNNPNLH